MLNNELLLSGRPKFSISTNVSSGGSISIYPQGKQYAGTLITVTCSPSSAYQFSSISIVKQDGTTVGYTTVTSGSKYTFIMPSSNVTVNVNYSLIPTYSISLSASGGSISANKTSGIRAGERITLTLTPNSYYVLSGISTSPNVSLSGSGNTRTFTMPSSNVRVTATFVSGYTLMVTVGVMRSNITIYGCYEGGYGSISPSTLTIGGKQVAFSELYCGAGNNWKRLDIHMIMDGKDFPPYLLYSPIQNMWVGRMDKGLKAQLTGRYSYATFSQDFFTEADVGKTIGVWVSNNPPPW